MSMSLPTYTYKKTLKQVETSISISSLHFMPLCNRREPTVTSSTHFELPVQGYPNPDLPFSQRNTCVFFWGQKMFALQIDLSSHTDFSWLPSTGLQGQCEVAPPRPHWDGLTVIFVKLQEMCCSAKGVWYLYSFAYRFKLHFDAST